VNIDYDFTFKIIILDHPLVKNIEETNPPQSNTDMSCSIPLVVFDFDHTLVDCNTDVEIQKLCPGGKLPDDLKEKMRKMEWTDFMQEVFDCLHQNGVTPDEIRKLIRSLPFMTEVTQMMDVLKSQSSEIIIISDANSVFISELLDAANLTSYITKVFTNPAYFDDAGKLRVQPFTHQTECTLSRPNMCKGQILEDYISSRKEDGVLFSPIAYAGDGVNDFCAMTRLPNKMGIALPRKGYSIVRHISKQDAKGVKIQAEVIKEWETLKDVSITITDFIHSNTN